MKIVRVGAVWTLLGLVTMGVCAPLEAQEGTVTKYVRFQADHGPAYGIVEGDQVREIEGDLFGDWDKTETLFPLDEIEILVPTTPSKVFAMAENYASHTGDNAPPSTPQAFFKVPSCLQQQGGPIELPTENVHYEGELVVVIGKRAKDVEQSDALDYVLGVTAGNDISARDWQSGDRQWWRAKAADTFGPCGPYIVSGLDYDNLELELRVNGDPMQKTNTNLLVHGVAKTVSFLSKHTTLEPGDLIFTGTPGTTKPLKAGDVVEVEIEGVGILKNPVVSKN